MKARIKGTRELVTIMKNIGYPGGYVASNGRTYHDEDLTLIVDEDPDYWTRLEHQAAIAAMQGICANYTEFTKDNDGTLSNTEMIVENARLIAHALVEK